jgi:hypothetical protein
MTKIKKLKTAILLSIFYFLFSSSAYAARLYFEPDAGAFSLDSTFSVNVKLDAENQEINAVDVNLSFPSDICKTKDFSDGGSIVNFWVRKPKAEGSRISFSGLIAGGFKGKDGQLIKIFMNCGEGNGSLIFQYNSQALLNDGKGTPASLKISDFQFLISKQIPISKTPISEIKDIEPPESFEPQIGKDPAVFDGKWFLVFATQDKQSGIDYYAVYESASKKDTARIEANDWTRAESPYLLKDQALKSFVYVKALDKAGNERIAALSPQNAIKWYDGWQIWGIITITIIVGWLILKKF